uniref:Uncharacterized protein n=1 Tax=Arundo donax TaxID=35708 RepID=A0A0A9DQ13_ARUDO
MAPWPARSQDQEAATDATVRFPDQPATKAKDQRRGGTVEMLAYIHTYARERERELDEEPSRRRMRIDKPRRRMRAYRIEKIASKQQKESLNGGSDPALPDQTPDQKPPRTTPHGPQTHLRRRNPSRRRRRRCSSSTGGCPRASKPVRHNAAREDGPGRSGSEACRRSGAQPAPFLIAADLFRRAAGSGDAIIGRGEWGRAGMGRQ